MTRLGSLLALCCSCTFAKLLLCRLSDRARAPLEFFASMGEEVAARTHGEWPELKQSVEEFFSEVEAACWRDKADLVGLPSEVGQLAEEELAAEGLLPAPEADPDASDLEPHSLESLSSFCEELKKAVEQNPQFFEQRGAELHRGLENILANHPQGSYAREDLFIKVAITEHVRSVFREIQSDSSNRTVLYANYKEEISRLTAEIRGESESLSANALVPRRKEMEERRARHFYKLYEQHKEQERAVTTKSEVPSLLRTHSASFNQADMQERQHLKRLQSQHVLLASKCLALHARQRDALSNITSHCHAEEQQAERSCQKKQEELQQELASLKAQFARCQHLLQDIRHQRRHAEQHRLQRAKVSELMRVAMRAEQQKKARHETMASRYAQGQAVLQAFATWMKDSYQFMETTLLDRQQRLAEELPEQGVTSTLCFTASSRIWGGGRRSRSRPCPILPAR
ncbi:unnamed protein product [Symbiodinium sp. CCMP2456]|nr:unnamed protein product [Symbiodinium sp. CCMP2456]